MTGLAVVTGAAGFIGSSLAEVLLESGWSVRGVDELARYYSVEQKMANLSQLAKHQGFDFVQGSLLELDPMRVLADSQIVFHCAAQPGVRQSWSHEFDTYLANNVSATHRLLEAMRGTSVERFVYSSSSSIYGQHAGLELDESVYPRPHSPYGVSKLAGEHLCGTYASNFGTPAVSLRYFTVFGPRQRPDMAISRLIRSALTGTPFTVFGDGLQVRDFTYVGDVVRANLAAASLPIEAGTAVNVAGGSSVTLIKLIEIVEDVTGRSVPVVHAAPAAGDVRETRASVERAALLLNWRPLVDIREGVGRQVEWYVANSPSAASWL